MYHCWKTPGWRLSLSLSLSLSLLSSSPSLHLTAPWGVSVASPLLSSPLLSSCVCVCVCVRARCCGRRLLPVPPYLHLLQSSANTHLLCALSLFLSLPALVFPTTYISLPTTIFFLLLFVEGERGADEGRK